METQLNLNACCPHSPADQAPMSFYLVRLIAKTPCMVLRLGFPIGTPAHTRNKVTRVGLMTRIGALAAYCAFIYSAANTFSFHRLLMSCVKRSSSFASLIVSRTKRQPLRPRERLWLSHLHPNLCPSLLPNQHCRTGPVWWYSTNLWRSYSSGQSPVREATLTYRVVLFLFTCCLCNLRLLR